MAKSKRVRAVSLTKVQKKPKSAKLQLAEKVKELAGKFAYVHLIRINHEVTKPLKDLRDILRPDVIVAGKARVMQFGLGATPETAAQDGIQKLSAFLIGTRALLFSNKDKDELEPALGLVTCESWLRCGDTAPETIVLNPDEGPFDGYNFAIEPTLRELGLPTQLVDGKVTLLGKYRVCKKGQLLSANAAKILRQLKLKLGQFKVEILASWNSESKDVSLHASPTVLNSC